MIKEVAKITKPNRDQQTIDTLTEMLDRAKVGEIQSILWVEKTHDNLCGHGWAGCPDNQMIGEIEELKFNFNSQKYFPVVDE
jgi:hypothetical protein